MKKLLTSTAFLLGALAITTNAQAAGFHLSEYSTTAIGRAFAGAGVVGDDYSAIGYNPAGMQYNKTSGMQIGASAVSLYTEYSGTTGAESGSGDTRVTRVLPNFFAQHKIDDKTTIGLGVYVPYGLATDYDNDWFGGAHGILSEVSTVDISPAISYQLTDMIAFGAALNLQYIDARLTSGGEYAGYLVPGAKSDLQGDDFAVGYTVGITLTPREDIRLGLSYRSKISHELQGDVDIKSPLGNSTKDIKAQMQTPEVATLSGAYDMNEKFTLSGTVRWTNWSSFETLDIYTTSGYPISQTDENWKDTWYYAMGLDYHHDENLTLRTGIGYDETTVKSSAYRTVRIPDGPRTLLSFGGSYKKDNWTFDVGYTHIFVNTVSAKGSTTVPAASNVDMKYNTNGEILSLGLQYNF